MQLIRLLEARGANSIAVSKVKAHQDLTTLAPHTDAYHNAEGNQDADAWQSGVYRPVRDRLERGSVGAVDGDPAGADPLCDLLPPAHSRHHVRGGEMMVFLLTTEGQCPAAGGREGPNHKGATS